jgi:hypothetical protein
MLSLPTARRSTFAWRRSVYANRPRTMNEGDRSTFSSIAGAGLSWQLDFARS